MGLALAALRKDTPQTLRPTVPQLHRSEAALTMKGSGSLQLIINCIFSSSGTLISHNFGGFEQFLIEQPPKSLTELPLLWKLHCYLTDQRLFLS